MNLKQCLIKINDNVSNQTRKEIQETHKKDFFMWHHGFGRWIRNNCNLWSDGTKEIIDNIQYLLNNGYEFQSVNALLEQKLLADPKIECDYSLSHPDNASGIIIEAYRDYLDNKLTFDMLP